MFPRHFLTFSARGKAIETPVPMDDDLDEPADEGGKGGYGPIRRKGAKCETSLWNRSVDASA